MGGLLDKPETKKITQHGEGNGLSYAVSSAQGWRLEMEDSDCAMVNLDGDLKDWSFFAVFDGHNGFAVSKYCSEKLLELIISTDEFKESIASKEFNEKQIELIEIGIKKAFLTLDETMKEHFEKNAKKDKSGTTVSCCLISPTHIFFSNCGDSRTIMCRSNNVIFSTNDHKPSKQVERERIKNAGGNVMLERVNGCLAVSRALGDYEYKQRDDKGPCEQLVSPEPEINVIKRNNAEDEFIILACDGVWDVMNNEDLSSFVRHQLQICNSLSLVTESVIDVCLNKASLDNMTVIVVKLPGAPKFDQTKSQLDNELNDIIIEKVKDLIQKSASFEKVFSEIKYDELKNMPPGVGIESKCSIIENIYFQKTGIFERYCHHIGIKRP